MRNHSQPLRRNSAIYREQDDLVLWLKFENNFDDSSYYEQKVIDFNLDVSNELINLPPFESMNDAESALRRRGYGAESGNYSAAFNTKFVEANNDIYSFDISSDDYLQTNSQSPGNAKIIRVEDGSAARENSARSASSSSTLSSDGESECLSSDLAVMPHYDYDNYTLEFLSTRDHGGTPAAITDIVSKINVYRKGDLTDAGFLNSTILTDVGTSHSFQLAVGRHRFYLDKFGERCYGNRSATRAKLFLKTSTITKSTDKHNIFAHVFKTGNHWRVVFYNIEKDSSTDDLTFTFINDITVATGRIVPHITDDDDSPYSKSKTDDIKHQCLFYDGEYFYVVVRDPATQKVGVVIIDITDVGAGGAQVLGGSQATNGIQWLESSDATSSRTSSAKIGTVSIAKQNIYINQIVQESSGTSFYRLETSRYKFVKGENSDHIQYVAPAFPSEKNPIDATVVEEVRSEMAGQNWPLKTVNITKENMNPGARGTVGGIGTLGAQGESLGSEALGFNGIDSRIELAHDYLLNLDMASGQSGPWTIELWFYPTEFPEANDYQVLFSKGSAGSPYPHGGQPSQTLRDYAILLLPDGRLSVRGLGNMPADLQNQRFGGGGESFESRGRAVLNQWNYLVLMRDNVASGNAHAGGDLGFSDCFRYRCLDCSSPQWSVGNCTMRLLLNGSHEAWWIKENFHYVSKVPLTFGTHQYYYGSYTNHFKGYMDQIRFSKISRYAPPINYAPGYGLNPLMTKDTDTTLLIRSNPLTAGAYSVEQQGCYESSPTLVLDKAELIKYASDPTSPVNENDFRNTISATHHAVNDDGTHLVAFFSNCHCDPDEHPWNDSSYSRPKGRFRIFKIEDDGSLSSVGDDIYPNRQDLDYLNTTKNDVVTNSKTKDKYRYYKNFYIKNNLLFCDIYPETVTLADTDIYPERISKRGNKTSYKLYENNPVTEVYEIDYGEGNLNIVYDPQKKMSEDTAPAYVNQVNDYYMWTSKRPDANIHTSRYYEELRDIYYPLSYEISTLPDKDTYIDPTSSQAMLVSGSGVFSLGTGIDSSDKLTFAEDQDFTIECWVKFNGIPNGDDDDPGAVIWDWGNLRLSNTSGYFTINDTEGNYTDYYDPKLSERPTPAQLRTLKIGHLTPEQVGSVMENKFIHTAVQRRNGEMELWIDHYSNPWEPNVSRNNKVFMNVAEDTTAQGIISGIVGAPHNESKAIGSTVSGTNFFTGWIDEFRVWDKAIYGPGPEIQKETPLVKGIYQTFNRWTNAAWFYQTLSRRTPPVSRAWYYTQSVCNYTWVGNWVYVESVLDPRYSLYRNMPYTVRWFFGNHLLGETGPGSSGPRVVQGQFWNATWLINSMGFNELLVQGAWGYYPVRAQVVFGNKDRPKYIYDTKDNQAGFVQAVANWRDCTPPKPPPPPPPPRANLSVKCHNGIVNVGDDIELKATLFSESVFMRDGKHRYADPSVVLPELPLRFEWSNKGRAIQEDECDPDVPLARLQSTHNYIKPCIPSSVLKWKNVRKSVKGPICVKVYDAKGNLFDEKCCQGFNVKLPKLECPVITSTTPNISTASYTYTPPNPYYRPWGWWWRCIYQGGDINGIGSYTERSITFGLDLVNPNIPELEDGGMIIQWKAEGYYYEGRSFVRWGHGSGQVQGFDPPTVNGSYMGHPNRPHTNGQTAGTTKTYTFPETFRGTIQASVSFDRYPNGMNILHPSNGTYILGKAVLITWNISTPECVEPFGEATKVNQIKSYGAAYRPWWVRNRETAYITHYDGWATTFQLGNGRESDQTVQTVYTSPCTTLELPIKFYKNDGRWNKSWLMQYQRGSTNTWKIEGDLGYDSADEKLEKVTSRSRAYPFHWYDILTVTKYIQNSDDGKYIDVVFQNECGERRLRYNIIVNQAHLMSKYKTSLSVGNRQVTKSPHTLPIYYQEYEIWNWYSGRLDTYYKVTLPCPNSDTQPCYGRYAYIMSLQASYPPGCYAYRLSVNGNVVSDWSMDVNYNSPSNFIILRTPSHRHTGGNILTGYSNRNGYLMFNVNSLMRDFGLNGVEVKLELYANFEDANNVESALDKEEFVWKTEIHKLPTITSWHRNRYPGWWYCGCWNYPYCSYWYWRRRYCYWWWPTYGWTHKQTTWMLPNENRMSSGGGYYLP